MATLSLPLSGNVAPSILPCTWMFNPSGGQTGLIDIEMGQSSAPTVEEDVLKRGRQLWQTPRPHRRRPAGGAQALQARGHAGGHRGAADHGGGDQAGEGAPRAGVREEQAVTASRLLKWRLEARRTLERRCLR